MIYLGSFFASTPRLWAFLAALFAVFESFGVFMSVFSSRVFPESVAAHAFLWSTIAVVPLAFAVAYVIWDELTNSSADLKETLANLWLARSLKVFTAYLAFVVGWGATLMAFGARGPFGADVMRGISGPELPLDEKYWPLVFLAGVALVLYLARTAATLLQEEAND